MIDRKMVTSYCHGYVTNDAMITGAESDVMQSRYVTPLVYLSPLLIAHA